MKNKIKNLKIVLGLCIIIFLAFFVYYTNKKGTLPTEEVLEVVKTESMLGCYVAKLAKDVYVLNIESEQNGKLYGKLAFNNYEKDSSSGSFIGSYENGILLGDYSFDSEGMHSDMQVVFKKEGDTFVRGFGPTFTTVEGKVTFEDLAGINYDLNSIFIKNETCRETFTEVNNKFTFDYNPFFKAYERNQEQNLPATDWRIDTKEKGMLLAHMSIPKTYLPNTNFANAYLTVGASTEPKAIMSCTDNMKNGEILAGSETISGFPFSKFISNGVGAGNIYETTSYRGLLDGDCYALEYTIHSTNIANYPTEQGVKEFDKLKIQNELENTIQSFKFLVNSD